MFKEACIFGMLTLGLAGVNHAETMYQVEFVVDGVPMDFDDSDGFDYTAITGLTAIFTVPEALTMTSDDEFPGTSVTRYDGLFQNSIVVHTDDGDIAIPSGSDDHTDLVLANVHEPEPGDTKKHVLYIDRWGIDIPSFQIELIVEEGHANYGNLINAGSPNPNLPKDQLFPTFDATTDSSDMFSSSWAKLVADGFRFADGIAMFDIKSVQIIPEPASFGLLGLGGLVLLRRNCG
ncbi:PEP-CTERM sorting domain-containing protein [Planctomycetota bacterium]|nr:PEP-CTERM sorting domain-containing protein [Planctomycetota bacterium]